MSSISSATTAIGLSNPNSTSKSIAVDSRPSTKSGHTYPPATSQSPSSPSSPSFTFGSPSKINRSYSSPSKTPKPVVTSVASNLIVKIRRGAHAMSPIPSHRRRLSNSSSSSSSLSEEDRDGDKGGEASLPTALVSPVKNVTGPKTRTHHSTWRCSSGPPQTSQAAPEQRAERVEYKDTFVCSGGVNLPLLLRATRTSLIEVAESQAGFVMGFGSGKKVVLDIEEWTCKITGPSLQPISPPSTPTKATTMPIAKSTSSSPYPPSHSKSRSLDLSSASATDSGSEERQPEDKATPIPTWNGFSLGPTDLASSRLPSIVNSGQRKEEERCLRRRAEDNLTLHYGIASERLLADGNFGFFLAFTTKCNRRSYRTKMVAPLHQSDVKQLSVTALLLASWINMGLYGVELVLCAYCLGWRCYMGNLFAEPISTSRPPNSNPSWARKHTRKSKTVGSKWFIIAIWILTTSIATTLEQTYFLHRFWTISKNWIVTSVLGGLILSNLVFILVIDVVFIPSPNNSVVLEKLDAPLVSALIITVVDISLAIVLVSKLTSVKTTRISTQRLLRKICIYVVGYGSITAVSSVLLFVMWAVDVNGRIYSLTVLCNFLLVSGWREEAGTADFQGLFHSNVKVKATDSFENGLEILPRLKCTSTSTDSPGTIPQNNTKINRTSQSASTKDPEAPSFSMDTL
ncbi:hypothetical protein J3R30DRAFT_3406835 [Lentinula aciculospora]|uniref:Transmembrane protein n=1 Tax=Lentinula aciculospora TaxID=153920 RepID=A0A9W9A2P1_9AGAR|nr:hypothetical protein J3R30DRAFT_3406835 [Lentinula aciculospora]